MLQVQAYKFKEVPIYFAECTLNIMFMQRMTLSLFAVLGQGDKNSG